MNRRLWSVIAIVLVVILTGCRAGVSGKQHVFSLDDVVQILREAGLEATVNETIEGTRTLFGVPGTVVAINQEQMVVYVYPSKDDQEKVQITDGGYMVSNGEISLHIDWKHPPAFIRKENLLIAFVTTNSALLDEVEAAISKMD